MERADSGVTSTDGGTAGRGRARPRGWAIASAAVLTAGLLVFHRAVPNSMGRLGSLLETFLPWLGLVL